jgi:2',3'-cyclic-nucleotide 2'-phosphodiesterase (5'-nucleotidase family)
MVKNKDGKEIPRSACGTKLAAIGYSRISGEDGSIDTNLYTWNNDASVTEMLGVDNEVGALVRAKKGELDDKLNETVASTDVELTINDPTEKDSSGAPVRMVRSAETNLGDFCADAYRDQSGADIAFVNGGGIRACIDKGDITLGDILNVHPYGNSLCVIEVTGQQVLDALEWGAHGLPEENGGFLQVSGLTYEADSNVPTPCKADGEGMMADTIRWKLVPGAMKLIVPATLHFFDDKKPAGSD